VKSAGYSVALVESKDGKSVEAHHFNCIVPRQLAAAGEPVVTLFGCAKPLPRNIRLHDCLKEDE